MPQVGDVPSMATEIKKLDPPGEANTRPSTVQSHNSYTTHSTYEADLLSEFAGMDEDCLLGEATVVKETKRQREDTVVEPPALPQKSSLRASRLLDSLKLSSIESATQSLTTPHDAYMSSEEDASSSADEFSDYDLDSCSEVSEGSSARRKSYEVTARVVSVVYSGKPSLVNLPSPRRSITSARSDTSSMSDSSIETPIEHPSTAERHPPRISSLVPSVQPAFLKKDPFPETHYILDSAKNDKLEGALQASKTPAVFNRVQRTFSLVRKRSRPFLRTSTATMSKEDLSLSSLPHSTIHLPHVTAPAVRQPTEAESPIESTDSPRSSVRYSDIIRTARKNAKHPSVASLPPMTPLSPIISSKKGILSSLKSNKRRSLKS